MDPLVKDKLTDFFGNYKLITFEKGENLIRADDSVSSIYFLTDGIVRRYTLTSGGQDITVNTFRAPSFFPMSEALNDTPNRHYYQAVTDSKTFKAPKEKVIEFLRSEPDVVFDLLTRIYRGLDGYMLRMEKMIEGSAYQRLVTELVVMAQRFGKQQNKKTIIPFKVTEHDLSNHSGLARETVSRELKILKDKNLVEIDHRQVSFPNLAKLEAEIEGS